MNNRNIAGNAILFLTALIWGCAFSAQEAGLAYMGPFSFNGIRSFVGCAFLLIVILISALFSRKKRPWNKQILIGGVICGSMLFVATSLQQIALAHTPAGKAAFITALYIVFVPFIRLIGGNKVTAFNWVGVGLACAGFWLLCITDGFAVGIGDLLLVGCAVIFAFDILAVDYFAPKVDAIKFSAVQFAVVGLLSATPIIFWEKPVFSNITAGWLPLMYAGVFSCGVAYTLQTVGQKMTKPTVAALIMSLESVFSVLCASIVLSESHTAREYIGCAVVFSAVIIAQIPARKGKVKSEIPNADESKAESRI